MSARAVVRNAPLSAQKARLVAEMVRHKKVDHALDILAFCPKRGARVIRKLLESAVANAKELEKNEKWHGGSDLNAEALFVKRITVDEGITLKRIRPRARGMAYGILRRRCHIAVEVDDRKT